MQFHCQENSVNFEDMSVNPHVAYVGAERNFPDRDQALNPLASPPALSSFSGNRYLIAT